MQPGCVRDPVTLASAAASKLTIAHSLEKLVQIFIEIRRGWCYFPGQIDRAKSAMLVSLKSPIGGLENL